MKINKLLAAFVLLSGLCRISAQAQPRNPSDPEAPLWIGASSQDKPEENYFSEEKFKKRLDEVLKAIQERAAEPIDPEKWEQIYYGALKGAAEKVDPYSTYHGPKKMKDFVEETKGNFSYGGIGLRFSKNPGEHPRVTSVLRGATAQKAGVQPEELILKIGDKDTLKMTLEEARNELRGPVGSDLILTIGKLGKKEIPEMRTVGLVRQEIRYPWILKKMAAPGIGYLYFTEFKTKTAEYIAFSIEEMKDHHGMKALILDLRSNPGGLLSESTDLCSLFLRRNSLILRVKARDWAKEYRSDSGGKHWPELPLAVLVDEGSASASEIVAGALQDHKRAVVIGSKTYGKGSVQHIIPFDSDKTGLRLTVAKYYLPSGRAVDKDPKTGEGGSSRT